MENHHHVKLPKHPQNLGFFFKGNMHQYMGMSKDPADFNRLSDLMLTQNRMN